jgi:hypothetical protein
MFHFHSWGRWSTIHKTEIISSRTGAVKGYSFIQERECQTCGLRKYKQHRISP